MDKVVKLKSVIKLLEDAAEEANKDAVESVGIDDEADAYFQGLRNGYLQAVDLLKKKSKQLA